MTSKNSQSWNSCSLSAVWGSGLLKESKVVTLVTCFIPFISLSVTEKLQEENSTMFSQSKVKRRNIFSLLGTWTSKLCQTLIGNLHSVSKLLSSMRSLRLREFAEIYQVNGERQTDKALKYTRTQNVKREQSRSGFYFAISAAKWIHGAAPCGQFQYRSTHRGPAERCTRPQALCLRGQGLTIIQNKVRRARRAEEKCLEWFKFEFGAQTRSL